MGYNSRVSRIRDYRLGGKHGLSQRASEIGALLVVLLLTGVALTPLLRADSPCTHDGHLHYFRIVAMRCALDDGLSVSRWTPDLAFGYGYPFFNYRAAFSYYLGEALYLLGLGLPLALNLVYVLGLVGSALGAYLLGRDLFGGLGGLVAATAYVYAPYSFVDALTRGNMPESVALALFPFILWSFRRSLLSARRRYLLTSAGELALLFLTHNISSLLFTPFVAFYLLVVWLARGRRDHLVRAGLALVLGVWLSAFFWAPAVFEKDQVQLYLSRATRGNDYHYHFIPLSEVLAPPEPVDTALLNPPLRTPVGLPLALLAVLGTGLALWRWHPTLAPGPDLDLQSRERWGTVAFFALSGGVMLFMATRASLVLWENLPLIPFVQFPWRFVGRAVLPLAMLAAALVTALPRPGQLESRMTSGSSRLTWCVVLVCVFLLVLTALPFVYPPNGYCPAQSQPDILDLFAYERSSGLVGVDPLGSYFPVTVRQRPTGSPLEAQYAAALLEDEPIARFDVQSLPDGAVLHRADYAPNRARLEVETPSAARARYLTFAFPGWRVYVDDRPTEVIPSDPEGLITFDLPAGRHTVEIAWQSTPTRTAATMLSLLALAICLFIAWMAAREHLARRVQGGASPEREMRFTPPGSLTWGRVALLALLALGLLAFKLSVVDRIDTPFRRSGLRADGTLPGLDVLLDVRFEDGVRLLGYDRSVGRMPVDGVLHLALYWSAYASPQRSYRARVDLVAPDGRLWSAQATFPRRGYAELPPSPTWGDGRYAVDGMDVEPPPGTPPGRYGLLLTAFDRETLAPLNVLDASGQVEGPNLIIGQIELTRPTRSPDLAEIPMQRRLGTDAGSLILAGVDLDRDQAAPGDPVLITLFWQVSRQKEALSDWRVYLALVSESGEEARSWELPPVRADWPTTLWGSGDLWRGQHMLRLPASLEDGVYTWQLSLYEPSSPTSRLPASPVTLGQLRAEAPERLWQAPPLPIAIDADLGGQVRLLGGSLEPEPSEPFEPSDILTVTLAWQAQAEMDVSYRVFLHLLEPDGGLLTQSDGEPVNWLRPTTGWAPGEVVLDERLLTIPVDATPGDYALVAGLYDPETKERLRLPTGASAVSITTITVKEP